MLEGWMFNRKDLGIFAGTGSLLDRHGKKIGDVGRVGRSLFERHIKK